VGSRWASEERKEGGCRRGSWDILHGDVMNQTRAYRKIATGRSIVGISGHKELIVKMLLNNLDH
jgi:hypothetical protein